MRVIAYFGSVAAGKKIEWVYRAWEAAESELGPTALVIAGRQREHIRPESIHRHYRVLGHLPSVELGELLRAVDVLALPFMDGVSERRSSFMAGLEAGAPVATTLGFSTGKTLRGADYLAAVAENDLKGYCDVVVRLLGDESRRRDLSARGQAAYQERYSWEIVIHRLEGLIDGLTSGGVRPSKSVTVSR